MSELSLMFEDIDKSFSDQITQLAKRVIDMLPSSSEAPDWWYDAAVDGAAEGITEAILGMTFESLAAEQAERAMEDRVAYYMNRAA